MRARLRGGVANRIGAALFSARGGSMRTTRRAFLALAGGFALVRPPSARGQEERIVTIGVLPFGTVSWEIETMRRSGFDAAHGFKAEVVKLASNEAARIAFQSGAVDTIVS